MSTTLTDAVNALITYANETTGASDTTLSAAFATLVAGYNGGSSGTVTYADIDGKPLTAAINALIAYSNEVTGASDTTASEAIATLVAGYSSGSSWDYEWTYTDGLLTANNWTLSGSGTEEMTSSGVLLTGQVELVAPVATMTIGVMEMDFIHISQSTGSTIYASISNGTNGAKFTIDRQYWRICNKALNSPWNMQTICTKGNGTYTIRMELGSSTSDYIVDGTTQYSGYSNSSVVDCTYNSVGYYKSGNSDTVTGIRYLVNRLS